jgi:hypothetical protein
LRHHGTQVKIPQKRETISHDRDSSSNDHQTDLIRASNTLQYFLHILAVSFGWWLVVDAGLLRENNTPMAGGWFSERKVSIIYLLLSIYVLISCLKGLDNPSRGLLMTGLLVMPPTDDLDDPRCAHGQTVLVFCVEFFQ